MSNLEVFMWGTRVGMVHTENYYPYTLFEYDKSFQRSGIELSPFFMKNNNEVYNFPFLNDEPFYHLPGLLAQSLPDNFGRTVLKNIFLSYNKRFENIDVGALLSLIGREGCGAIEYVPSANEEEIKENVDISDITFLLSQILKDSDNVSLLPTTSLSYKMLFPLCARVQGDSPKANVYYNKETKLFRCDSSSFDEGYKPYIIKFDNILDKASLNDSTLVEYAYYKMALKSGINMSKSFIYSLNGKNHFMTKRFDRVKGKKVFMQSLCSLSHISYKDFNSCSYEKASDIMHALKLPYKDIEQFYRRMVFNVLSVNEDDNVKNVSFLMDKKGKWTLSPCYDVTFNQFDNGRKMSISHKTSYINRTDLLLAGKHMGIKSKDCREIISEVGTVVNSFRSFATECGVGEYTISKIEKAMKENNSAIWF